MTQNRFTFMQQIIFRLEEDGKLSKNFTRNVFNEPNIFLYKNETSFDSENFRRCDTKILDLLLQIRNWLEKASNGLE